MTSLALVLEGGGLRGQYTAGVLDAFLEAGVEFPCVLGVSAGASIASSYVSRQPGRNRTIVNEYRNDPRYLSLANFVRTGSLFGMDFIYRKIPFELVPFDFETFDASPTRFITVCTDATTGEAIYYEKGKSDLLTVLRASASMPYLSPLVRYEDRELLDGAVADSIPLLHAYKEGFSGAVVVLTRPAGYRKKPSSSLPAKLVYGRHPNLVQALSVRWRVYNEQLNFVNSEESAGRALVIRPSRDLGIARTEKNVEKLDELYLLGKEDGQCAAAKLVSAS